MPLFLWKKSYEIGVVEIDVQHRRLVGFINELADAMMVKQGYRAVPHIIEELVDYIQQHFTAEEALMQRMNYPAMDEHCQEHLAMTSKVLEFKDQYSRDHELDSRDVLNFMCDWLRNHIIINDKELGRYIRNAETGLKS